MPKTEVKTRVISISLPIEVDDFLNLAVKAYNEKYKDSLTKSRLVSVILANSISEFENMMKAQEKTENKKTEEC